VLTVEAATAHRAPAEAYRLSEAVSLEESALAADNTVTLQVLRPCVGRGKGRHLYEADMLAKNAHKFKGWRMYVDHLSEEARRKLGGLPRSLRDAGGRVVESWWDASVPADPARGFGEGSVMAKVRPTRIVRELIEDDPALVEASINARATAVRPVKKNSEQVWAVEGIEDDGSIDWVTEAGAGGRVVSLLEGVYHDGEMDLLESMTDEEFAEYVRGRRPGLIEALAPRENGDEDVSDTDKGKGGESQAPDALGILREALGSYEGREMLRSLMEADMREESDLIRAQAEQAARREVELERLKAEARDTIREAKLPAAFEADLLERYDIVDNLPTPALDVVDEVDGEGSVVKRAGERVRESVAKDIKRQRELIEAVDPTRVKGQGGGGGEGEGDESAPAPEKPKRSLWRGMLQEAGFTEPEKVYEEV
jgi:hypothetical protein